MRCRILWVPVLVYFFVGCDSSGDLDSDKGKDSYSIGYQMGSDLRGRGIDVGIKAMVYGLRDALEGKPPKISENEIAAASQRVQQRVVQALELKARQNAEVGRRFLEENKKRPGVTTTSSGLQYQVLLEGTGPIPKDGESVKVHYVGTFIDGTKFDSSVDRNQPAIFDINKVIRGWTEALKLMKTGARFRMAVPPDLGYGPNTQQGIPPNSVLLFEVELLEVIPAKK